MPTASELDRAYLEGFDAIDEGLTFIVGFGDYLMGLGYRFDESSPCTCSDNGRHGHLTECRWMR